MRRCLLLLHPLLLLLVLLFRVRVLLLFLRHLLALQQEGTTTLSLRPSLSLLPFSPERFSPHLPGPRCLSHPPPPQMPPVHLLPSFKTSLARKPQQKIHSKLPPSKRSEITMHPGTRKTTGATVAVQPPEMHHTKGVTVPLRLSLPVRLLPPSLVGELSVFFRVALPLLRHPSLLLCASLLLPLPLCLLVDSLSEKGPPT
mmetsp:Transcript_47644/g.94019  ORF Transcript_47644/g.94019 Transcript_47644/m.94019 type:complete len:200 (+) Transcript_47644:553-1152(+)